jgi:hypothetical protein
MCIKIFEEKFEKYMERIKCRLTDGNCYRHYLFHRAPQSTSRAYTFCGILFHRILPAPFLLCKSLFDLVKCHLHRTSYEVCYKNCNAFLITLNSILRNKSFGIKPLVFNKAVAINDIQI